MKITAISSQKRNNNRVNISIDGEYRFSLDLYQVVDLGIKIGKEYSDSDLIAFETESQFGKIYGRALEYCLVRPRSSREMRDYLNRKTRPTVDKNGFKKPGVPPDVTCRVFDRLVDKKYIDDYKFAKYWIDNRSVRKGVSKVKLNAELRQKGIDSITIDQIFSESERSDGQEIKKIIAKKRQKYPDERKMIEYLARQGFRYDDIKTALQEDGY